MAHRFNEILLILFLSSAMVLPAEKPDNPDYSGRSFILTFNDLLSGREVSTVDTPGGNSHLLGTLIVFWSINCSPCLREIPELNAIYSEWQPKGLEIIGIPQDERPEKVIDLCRRFRITWPQFMESGPPFEKPLTAEWLISQTPFFLLLDARGRVIANNFYRPSEVVEQFFL